MEWKGKERKRTEQKVAEGKRSARLDSGGESERAVLFPGGSLKDFLFYFWTRKICGFSQGGNKTGRFSIYRVVK